MSRKESQKSVNNIEPTVVIQQSATSRHRSPIRHTDLNDLDEDQTIEKQKQRRSIHSRSSIDQEAKKRSQKPTDDENDITQDNEQRKSVSPERLKRRSSTKQGSVFKTSEQAELDVKRSGVANPIPVVISEKSRTKKVTEVDVLESPKISLGDINKTEKDDLSWDTYDPRSGMSSPIPLTIKPEKIMVPEEDVEPAEKDTVVSNPVKVDPLAASLANKGFDDIIKYEKNDVSRDTYEPKTGVSSPIPLTTYKKPEKIMVPEVGVESAEKDQREDIQNPVKEDPLALKAAKKGLAGIDKYEKDDVSRETYDSEMKNEQPGPSTQEIIKKIEQSIIRDKESSRRLLSGNNLATGDTVGVVISSPMTKKKEITWNTEEYIQKVNLQEPNLARSQAAILERKTSVGPCYRGPREGPSGITICLPKSKSSSRTIQFIEGQNQRQSGIYISIAKKNDTAKVDIRRHGRGDDELNTYMHRSKCFGALKGKIDSMTSKIRNAFNV